jgi:hypothetical protein
MLAEHDWLLNRSFIPPPPANGADFAQRLTREAHLRQIVVDELERVDLGKMNLQLIADVENQDPRKAPERVS